MRKETKKETKKKTKKVTKKSLVIVAVFFGYFLFTVLAAILYDHIPILINYSIYSQDNFWYNLILGMHNSIIDFAVLGLILTYLTHRIDKENEKYHEEQEKQRKKDDEKRELEEKIRRYHENIGDTRFWFSEQAMYSLTANLKRLQEMQQYEAYNLSKCFLENSKLKDMIYIKSDFRGTSFTNATLRSIIFKESDFKGANFKDAKLSNISFEKCRLWTAKFVNADCSGVNFKGVELKRSDFSNANLRSADFRGADLDGVIFDEADLRSANFRKAKNINVQSLKNGKNLKYIIADEEILTAMQ